MRLSLRAHSIELPNIRIGVTHVQHGGLLIYPTETAYALGCDATNARAVRAIFRLKGRERGKPLPLIVASRAMAERYARFTPLARQLAKRWWPGPLTIVLDVAEVFRPPRRVQRRGFGERGDLKVAATFAPGVLARDGTIAIRVSPHPVARALSQRLGRPIVSTSANHSGQPPCYSVRSALRSFNLNFLPFFQRGSARGWNVERVAPGGGPRIAALNIGPLPRRKPSTIVDARGGRTVVLRRGSIVV